MHGSTASLSSDPLYETVEHVPVDDYTLPLSSAEVLQSGETITLLSWGAPLYSCVEAINMLRDPPPSIAAQVPQGIRGADVELIDLRTILPWDRESACEPAVEAEQTQE
jgi:2-oxoisovalerate dehydrogenase E1 component beta subunit